MGAEKKETKEKALETLLLRVPDLAKAFSVSTKEITSILSGPEEEVKSSASISPEQFGFLFEELTRNHQVTDIDAYFDGDVVVKTKVKEEPKETKAPAKAAPDEAKKAPASAEPAPKAETKPEVKTAEAPKDKPAQAPAAKAAQTADTPKKETEPAKPKEPAKPVSKPAVSPAPAPVQAPKGPPKYNIPAKAISANVPGSVARPAPGSRPQPFQKSAGSAPRSGAVGHAPTPFPSRGGRSGPDYSSPVSSVSKSNAELLAEMNLPRHPASKPTKGSKNKNGKGAFGGQGRNDNDKDYGGSSAPHEKYKAPEIVRGATTASSRGATRVIDTRSSAVDIDKFNRSYDEFAPEVEDERTSPQKVKKQSGPSQTQKNGKAAKGKNGKKQKMVVPKLQLNLELPDEILVNDLAAALHVTTGEVIKKLFMSLDMAVKPGAVLDYDTAALVAEEFGATVSKKVVVTIEDKLFDQTEDKEEDLVERAPVVCVMGHVDHGKTSLLDAIRNTHVTAGEAGGITQHIGAYRVEINGKSITFLDTPGHEAFTAMRARGAMATDIAILVVAADDGIMPQTVEAINHAKAAGVDIIVAINKMDKPTADPDAVKQALTKYDLVPEEWGGDVICVPVSAVTHMGIDELLDNVLVVAEVKELRANPNRLAKGVIIESRLDKGVGPVATVLVQNGTLKNGDIVIAGTAVGRVRLMRDSTGRTVKEAGPSVPVEIIGLADVPGAGDEFAAVENERMARELAEQRKESAKQEVFKANSRSDNPDDLFKQVGDGLKELPIIVKADVDGSVEAVRQALEKLSNDEVRVHVIHAAAGGITETDVMLASASGAMIVGFNVRPDKSALDSAERQGVDIRTYRIIYECTAEIEAAMKGMLAPKYHEVLLGHVQVRQVIHVPNVGFIAGSYVQDGKITRASRIRVVRDGVVIAEDKVSSLRRFKDDVREVGTNFECGVGLEKFNDLKVDDILEAFVMEEDAEA